MLEWDPNRRFAPRKARLVKTLVSSCLLGKPCRYDGRSCPDKIVQSLHDTANVEFISVCPEVLGGLPTPRPASELATAERAVRVTNRAGADVTDEFLNGAAKTVEQARAHGCTLAVLKAKSPSCGNGPVYDGTFSGTLVPGCGVTARALLEAGVRVVDETQLAACLRMSEKRHPGSSPALFAATSTDCPVLETERLVLRPLVSSDIDDVFAYCSDPAVGLDAGWAPHRTREDSRMFVEVIARDPHVFGMFERVGKETIGPCIGSIGLIADPKRRNPDCLMLGYALARTAWGRGYATEASHEVLRYGFEELGLGMISCTCYSTNERSRHVIEKAGFIREGTIHAAETAPDGLMRDLETYYLPRDRWISANETGIERSTLA